MTIPTHYSFTRFLAAKKPVDDRALNRGVWAALAEDLAVQAAGRGPLRVLEAGAGIGTMLERVFEWGLLDPARFLQVHYRLVDADHQHILNARQRIIGWAQAKGVSARALPHGGTPWRKPAQGGFPTLDLSAQDWPAWSNSFGPGEPGRQGGLTLERPGQQAAVHLEAADILELAARPENRGTQDLLIAHAFLDLLDLPSALPLLLGLLRPGGLFYFTLNFDGATLLEPGLDPELDERIQALYHRTMDERRTGGRPSGDSRTGRRLFGALKRCGARITAAGASDWVVFPGKAGYPEDEAFFLHFIVHTIQEALKENPELDREGFSRWIAGRHAQVERCELVYIAHQLDFAGTIPGPD
jgi:SAM-dependent methyltransferase